MRKPSLHVALAAALLLASQVAPALNFDGEALGAPTTAFEYSPGTNARAMLAEHSHGTRAARDDDAPPPHGVPQEDLDDGFQRYFDRHSRVHAASDAALHESRGLD